MSDYLYWDESDVDLSAMLGEWTEYELDFSSDSWSEDEDNSTERPKPKTKTKHTDTPSVKKTCYQCPLCPKQYLSVSGFRGHVVNKHKRYDVIVSQHKVSDTQKAGDITAVPVCDKGITNTSSSITTFTDNSFAQLLESAVSEVCNNPNHNSITSKSGGIMVEIGKAVISSPVTMQHLETLIKPPLLDTLAVFWKDKLFLIRQGINV
ncbi:uncharacterized protein LOC124286204 [Haliotis rubra]|uniref:uncharacterized protein LOC124286204 n=1 Tax=Haliotis rubra TaxID=36100 RepID=UPI001EE5FEAE|nr:uncharacterized protein LOC124286204 [Haliotis rubra]